MQILRQASSILLTPFGYHLGTLSLLPLNLLKPNRLKLRLISSFTILFSHPLCSNRMPHHHAGICVRGSTGRFATEAFILQLSAISLQHRKGFHSGRKVAQLVGHFVCRETRQDSLRDKVVHGMCHFPKTALSTVGEWHTGWATSGKPKRIRF